jgi:hypothetical protein
MTEADLIWNRAVLENGGAMPRDGDLALTALMRAHGLTMNGGILHAVDILSQRELTAARAGYRFFGFGPVASLFSRAKDLLDADADLDAFERILDHEYASYVPSDSVLVERFESHLATSPSDFAPL